MEEGRKEDKEGGREEGELKRSEGSKLTSKIKLTPLFHVSEFTGVLLEQFTLL